MSSIDQLSSTYTGAGAGTESGKPIKTLTGSGSSRPPVYAPPTGAGGGPETGNTPGTYTISPFAPGETAGAALQETEDGLAGFKNSIFGTSAEDINGQHGGGLGDIPLLGAAGRAVSETVANVGGAIGTAGKAGLDAVGGALEHVDLSNDASHRELQAKFEQLPDAAQQAARDAIANDPGATGHYMAKAVNDYNKDQRATGNMVGKPDFMTGAMDDTTGSAAEAVDDILGGLGLTSRWAARTFEGVGTPGQGGMDRLGLIMAVGNGQAAFNEDKGVLGTGFLAGDPTTGLNPVEQIVFKKVSEKDWTPDQGRDFLAAQGAAYSHSAVANLAGTAALDPQIVASLGVAGIARLGATGARIVGAVEDATRAVEATQTALDAAKAAGAADRVAELTSQLATDQKALSTVARGAYKIGGDVSRLNPLGQAARSETVTGLVRGMYRTYEGLQAVHIDKALKIGRAIVDPLGAMSLHNPFRKQMIDLLSDDAVHQVIGAYGQVAHAQLIHTLSDVGGNVADRFAEDMGTYSANLTRRVIARAQRDYAVAHGYAGKIMKKNVNEVLADLGDEAPKSFQEHILREANRFRITAWDDEKIANLAERLADNYKTLDAKGWTDWLTKESLNADQLSMLHAATYGRATSRLLDALGKAGGLTGSLAGKGNRIILVNRTTLTQEGAAGIIARIEAAGTAEAKATEVLAAQKLYPELRGFRFDATLPEQSANRFAKELKSSIPAYPRQLVDDEIASLPDDLKALHTDKTYTLAFSPEDEYKWGLVRHNTEAGGWAPIHDVWVDHVAPGVSAGYRPMSRLVEQNVAGQPILGAVGKVTGRTWDYIDAGIRTMGQRVSGAVIADAARNHFIQNAAVKYSHVGVTEEVAGKMMDALEDAVRAQDIVVRPSGFSSKQMWEAAKKAIPNDITAAEFTRRDLMGLVLEAYKGDMRYVGVTQALSSRVKRVLALDSNNASVLAEQVYPNLKFRLNVIFQAQEKIEPFVLNAFRGITPAKSARTLNTADKATAVLLERMMQRSLITNADHEMAEYAGGVLHGKDIYERAAAGNTAMGQITKHLGVDWDAIRDVKGVKQVNTLRTFRKGLGKEMRASWDQTHPGAFDEMFREAVRKANRGAGGLDEDEFAVSLMAEQMLGSDVEVTATLENRLGKLARQYDHVDYSSAIKPGEWSQPQTLGSLKQLDLDTMAAKMAFPMARGAVTKNQADLRAAIASGHVRIEDVELALRRLNADPDYVARVSSALKFSWTGFWSQAEHDFNLTRESSASLQDMVANAAALRNMTPVDYLSQIMIPTIGEGAIEPVLGHLGQMKTLLSGGEAPDLAQLRVLSDGAGTEDQFIHQLATVFTAHLDPSSKLTLLKAFKPELEQRLADAHDIAIADINRLWTPEMDDEFTRLVTGQMNLTTGNLADQYEAGLLRTVADWDRVDPKIEQTILTHSGAAVPGAPVTQFIGDGLRAAAPAVQKDILHTIGRLQADFPGTSIKHVDIVDDISPYLESGEESFGVAGVAVHSSTGGDVLIFNSRYYGNHPTLSYEDFWRKTEAGAADFQHQAMVATENPLTGAADFEPRQSALGAQQFARNDAQGTVTHEFGHAIHTQVMARWEKLKTAGKLRTAEGRLFNKYAKTFGPRDGEPSVFETSLAGRRLSEYAQSNTDEAMAELHSIAFFTGPEEEALAMARKIDAATEDAAKKMLEAPTAAGHVPEITNPQDLDHFYAYVKQELPGYDMSDWEALAREWEGAYLDGDVEGAVPALAALHKESKSIAKEIAAENKDILRGKMDSIRDLKKGPQTVEDAVKQVRADLKAAGVYKPKPVNADFIAGDAGVQRVGRRPIDVASLRQPEEGFIRLFRGSRGEAGDAAAHRGNGFEGPGKYLTDSHDYASSYAHGGATASYIVDESKIVDLSLLEQDDTIAQSLAILRADPVPGWEKMADGLEKFADALGLDKNTATSLDIMNLSRTSDEEFTAALKKINKGGIYFDTSNWSKSGAFADQAFLVKDPSILKVEHADVRTASRMAEPARPIQNPEVIRAYQQFGKWTTAVVGEGLKHGENASQAATLAKIAGIPTTHASPFNMTEHALMGAATETMKSKWDDAFRLQYYARQRTMLERSVNHPMFGIYPASYMWGKVLPEMTRFIAKEPFGLDSTGALGYSLMDIQKNVALQREFDPEFDKQIEGAGHSAAVYALGYMMPSWPWEASAAWPGWMREFSQEGLDMQARVDAGGSVATPAGSGGINLPQVGQKALDTMNPINKLDTAIGKPLEEINAPKVATNGVPLGFGGPSVTNAPVKAADLGNPLTDALQSLQNLLGGH